MATTRGEFQCGEHVMVLRSVRLPIEDPLGVGVIERVTRSSSGDDLYWVRGFDCARTARVLRRGRVEAQ